MVDEEKNGETIAQRPSTVDSVEVVTDHTHRNLKSRHIQLMGIGGTIGTALYVQIGRGLMNGGPGSLFLAFTLWCTVILAITTSIAEMVTYLPVSSPFIRFAGRFVDEAFGVAAGWNFFIFEAFLVPFEIVACNVIIGFWSDAVPTGAIIAIVIVLYGVINMMAVKWYGETEFWAALCKVLLIVGLLLFTFMSMLGGNPERDRYGFRYWKTPGSFAELYYRGNLGRFLGFLQCLIQAAFVIAGPEYVSMAAGETANPRVVMPRAYKAVFYRLTAFFVLGSLAVGINVPYNDPELLAAFQLGKPGAAASPYVIAMNRLRIEALPHLVNAGVLASAFSAGNSYVYCASRSLYGLALEGKAPRIFTRCTGQGVPYLCVALVLSVGLLSFLQLGRQSAVVLTWFVSLITASQLINFSVMTFTFTRFYHACRVQGFDRALLPYTGYGQPYAAYYALVCTFVMTFVGGYPVFLTGHWDLPSFLFSYLMVFLFPILYVGWKLLKRTQVVRAHEADLVSGVAEIEQYTQEFVDEVETNPFNRLLNRVFG